MALIQLRYIYLIHYIICNIRPSIPDYYIRLVKVKLRDGNSRNLTPHAILNDVIYFVISHKRHILQNFIGPSLQPLFLSAAWSVMNHHVVSSRTTTILVSICTDIYSTFLEVVFEHLSLRVQQKTFMMLFLGNSFITKYKVGKNLKKVQFREAILFALKAKFF